MSIDRNGSYIREPSVSEHALRQRLEELANAIPLNNRTTVERTMSFDDTQTNDIDFHRSKKELEASLVHQINNGVTVKLHYNEAWDSFEARELEFPLPGTTSLQARLELDQDSTSYSSYLYDKNSDSQIARGPVQLATVDTLLTKAGISPRIPGTGEQLAATIFATAQPGEDLLVRQSFTLSEEEMPDDISGSCWIEREQSYSDDDIVDVIRFITDIHTGEKSHARVISVVNSQHGSMITVEEVSSDVEGNNVTRRTLQLDYSTIEKLLKHVNNAFASFLRA